MGGVYDIITLWEIFFRTLSPKRQTPSLSITVMLVRRAFDGLDYQLYLEILQGVGGKEALQIGPFLDKPVLVGILNEGF